MTSDIQRAVISACREFLRPIVRFLLKNGIGYREFSEICKETYVDIASNEYGIRGRKTNMSRVAVMTGLSRKEIKKIRDAAKTPTEGFVSRTRRPELVLSLWHTDPAYLDARHRPKRIRFGGDGATFCELVARAGGDIPPRAMLKELLRAGSVVEEGQKLRAVSRSYIPEPHDPQAILVAGGAIRDLVSTVYYNLGCDDASERFFERRVYSEKLPDSYRRRFRKLARDKGQILLQDLNSWLSEKSAEQELSEENGDPSDTSRIGVGIYFFESFDTMRRSEVSRRKPK